MTYAAKIAVKLVKLEVLETNECCKQMRVIKHHLTENYHRHAVFHKHKLILSLALSPEGGLLSNKTPLFIFIHFHSKQQTVRIAI